MSESQQQPYPENGTAAAIVNAIRELNRHIEHQRWSSNCAAICDRTRLVDALIEMTNQPKPHLLQKENQP